MGLWPHVFLSVSTGHVIPRGTDCHNSFVTGPAIFLQLVGLVPPQTVFLRFCFACSYHAGAPGCLEGRTVFLSQGVSSSIIWFQAVSQTRFPCESVFFLYAAWFLSHSFVGALPLPCRAFSGVLVSLPLLSDIRDSIEDRSYLLSDGSPPPPTVLCDPP